MNSAYWMVMIASAAAAGGWLLFRMRQKNMKCAAGAVGVLFSVALGLILAKGVYLLSLHQAVWPRYGWGSVLRVRAAEMSFFGGCLGAVAGMALSARLFRQNVKSMLDAFAPCGALMIAGARFAEYFLDLVGVGDSVEDPFFTRFPFAVMDKYEEWSWAVFMLEVLAALIIAMVFSLRRREDLLPGLRMERTVYYLCVFQILFESLRSDGLRRGFVRVEQVMCAVTMAVLLCRGCAKAPASGALGRFWPVAAALGLIAVDVGVEFGLDKTNLPTVFWYGVMCLTLAGFWALENFCVKRRLARQKSPELQREKA